MHKVSLLKSYFEKQFRLQVNKVFCVCVCMCTCRCVCVHEWPREADEDSKEGGAAYSGPKAKSGPGHSLSKLYSLGQPLQTSFNVAEQLHWVFNVSSTSPLTVTVFSKTKLTMLSVSPQEVDLRPKLHPLKSAEINRDFGVEIFAITVPLLSVFYLCLSFLASLNCICYFFIYLLSWLAYTS